MSPCLPTEMRTARVTNRRTRLSFENVAAGMGHGAAFWDADPCMRRGGFPMVLKDRTIPVQAT
jgi:hypothetical protein